MAVIIRHYDSFSRAEAVVRHLKRIGVSDISIVAHDDERPRWTLTIATLVGVGLGLGVGFFVGKGYVPFQGAGVGAWTRMSAVK